MSADQTFTPNAPSPEEVAEKTARIELEKEKKRLKREEKKAERLKKRRRYFLEKLIAPAIFLLTVVIALLVKHFAS